jgi:NAD(P)-dependent dehydrogenase (short-subunit alcohol dehydrogenase family)
MINPLDLSGKTIMVTGASGGIGRETACLLSELGARLVLVGRNVAALDETLHRLDGAGHFVESFDLRELDAIPDWMRRLNEAVGPLDGLVHCAGVQQILPLRALSPQKLDDVLRVNFHAGIMLAKCLCRKTAHRKPASLVFVSSVMGLVGQPGRAAYSASKGALEAATRSLALELAPESIRVNCIAPAFVRTEMFADLSKTMTQEQIQAVERAHPLGIGEPRDVAGASAFLLAGTGRWITGTTLVIDGGYCAQ